MKLTRREKEKKRKLTKERRGNRKIIGDKIMQKLFCSVFCLVFVLFCFLFCSCFFFFFFFVGFRSLMLQFNMLDALYRVPQPIFASSYSCFKWHAKRSASRDIGWSGRSHNMIIAGWGQKKWELQTIMMISSSCGGDAGGDEEERLL